MGFVEILTLIFITLKLMGYITWEWWIVLSPFWGFYGFLMLLFLIATEDKSDVTDRKKNKKKTSNTS